MIDKLPPRADETDKCPPHWWLITTDKGGNQIHKCCKPGCLARKVIEKADITRLGEKIAQREVYKRKEIYNEPNV